MSSDNQSFGGSWADAKGSDDFKSTFNAEEEPKKAFVSLSSLTKKDDAKSGGFGFGASDSGSKGTTTTFGGFGKQSGGFGFGSTTSPDKEKKPGFGFGQSSDKPTSFGGFGSTTTPEKKKPGFGFDQSSKDDKPKPFGFGSSSFGTDSKSPSDKDKKPFSFGSSGTSSFGATPTKTTTSSFTGGFGTSDNKTQDTKKENSFSFGASTTTSFGEKDTKAKPFNPAAASFTPSSPTQDKPKPKYKKAAMPAEYVDDEITWKTLNFEPKLIQVLYEMEFIRPTIVQAKSIPEIRAGKSVAVQAKTGEGKTAAFLLGSMLSIDQNIKAPQVLIISMTLELADQTFKVAEKLNKGIGVSIGFLSTRKHINDSKVDLHSQLIIATPGKFKTALKRNLLPQRDLKTMIFDEADHMLAEGSKFYAIIRQIRKRLKKLQLLLFSATFNDTIKKFAMDYWGDSPHYMLVQETNTTHDESRLIQMYSVCTTDKEKLDQLAKIYIAMDVGEAIIFCNTKRTANIIKQRMGADGHDPSLLTGDLDPAARLALFRRFIEGETRMLITTDVLSRGIDNKAVSLVVNYDMPVIYNQNGAPNKDLYIHRTGRTARMDLQGVAFSFISPDQQSHIDFYEKELDIKFRKMPTCDVEDLMDIMEKLNLSTT